mmetsp:Transcript_30744/g.74953  ORF Transcript_30744/g.74953 Transcript_30744/m.74953 type:complete len:201 (+) Transcript_30744:781-1383(+)
MGQLSHCVKLPRAPAKEDERILISFGIHLLGCQYMIFTSNLFIVCGPKNERRRCLLNENHISVPVPLAKDGKCASHLVPIELVAHCCPQSLPCTRCNFVHHVDENGVKDGNHNGLQGQTDAFFLLCQCWILESADWAKHLRYFLLLLSLWEHVFVLEHESLPQPPPCLEVVKSPVVAINHCGSVNLVAVKMNGVGNPIRH